MTGGLISGNNQPEGWILRPSRLIEEVKALTSLLATQAGRIASHDDPGWVSFERQGGSLKAQEGESELNPTPLCARTPVCWILRTVILSEYQLGIGSPPFL